jgi:hypothetical protein
MCAWCYPRCRLGRSPNVATDDRASAAVYAALYPPEAAGQRPGRSDLRLTVLAHEGGAVRLEPFANDQPGERGDVTRPSSRATRLSSRVTSTGPSCRGAAPGLPGVRRVTLSSAYAWR